MKFDSEEQRNTVIEMLSTVRVTVTMRNIAAQKAEWDRLLKAMMEAGIEPPPKRIVPIDFLAPDTPGHIRRFAGMPGFEEANGGE